MEDNLLRVKGPPGMRIRMQRYVEHSGMHTDVSEASRAFIIRGLEEEGRKFFEIHKKPPPWMEALPDW